MVHEYSLKIFGNELFNTLAFIKEHQHKIWADWYCKMSQQEIADSLHISKLKANRYIRQLKEYGFLKYYGDIRISSSEFHHIGIRKLADIFG